MRVKLNRWKTSLAILFVATLCVAQSPTAFITTDIRRAGDKLACLCGACKNTVGTCQMLGCHYAAPAREKIAELQKAGLDDEKVAAFFVKREGLKAFAVPPAEGFNAMSWIMPPVAILLGLGGIAWWIRRSRKPVLVDELPAGSADRVRAELDQEMAKFD
ncbi:MAG: cytochrome c-type biogenesis protein CcmH [Bryobacteraceae bacterium]|nr:cytochrome c-type biogenesis protein CcmH [Bryobacteraceae bacterium]